MVSLVNSHGTWTPATSSSRNKIENQDLVSNRNRSRFKSMQHSTLLLVLLSFLLLSPADALGQLQFVAFMPSITLNCISISLGLLVKIFCLWTLHVLLSLCFVRFPTTRFQLAIVMLLARPLLCVFLVFLVFCCRPSSPGPALCLLRTALARQIFSSCPFYLCLISRHPSSSIVYLLSCSFFTIPSFSFCDFRIF